MLMTVFSFHLVHTHEMDFNYGFYNKPYFNQKILPRSCRNRKKLLKSSSLTAAVNIEEEEEEAVLVFVGIG